MVQEHAVQLNSPPGGEKPRGDWRTSRRMTGWRTASVLLVMALSGCPKDECSASGLERVQPVGAPVGLTGTPSRHTLGLGTCARGVTSVTSAVTDAEGNAVPSQVVTELAPGTAVVEFTPTSPGTHSIVVRFEPALGEAKKTVVVLRDRSSEAPVLRFRPRNPCQQVVVAGDLALCESDVGLAVLHAGVVVGGGPVSSIAAAGPVLWSWSTVDVRRWELVDGGVQSAVLPRNNAQVFTGVRGVTPGLLVLADPSGFLGFTPGDGGLEAASLPYQPSVPLLSGVAVVDGGLVWVDTAGQACFGAPSMTPNCRDWSLQVMAPEGDGLWVQSALGEVGFARFTASPAPIALQLLRLDVEATAQLPLSAVGYPQLRFGPHWVAIDRDTLRLDAWRSPDGGVNGGVSATHVWFESPSGEVSVFAR